MYSLVKLLKMIGLPATVALVLAVLIVENKPLSLNELSAKTGYTKGHLSSILRLLETRELIERVYERRRKLMVKVRGNAIFKLLKEHLRNLRKATQEAIAQIRDEIVSELKLVDEELSKMLKNLEGNDL